jgi:regulator of sirC expression with transglutaminase-like and TPR domain
VTSGRRRICGTSRAAAPRERLLQSILSAASLALVASLCGCRATYTSTVILRPLPRTLGLRAESIEEVLRLPEEEIDIGRAALLVSREDRPGIDLDRYLARLDEAAARLRRRVPDGTTVREAVARLVAEVESLIPGGRAAETEIPASGPRLPSGMDLASILDGARGNCLGLSILYLAVAERAGFPLRGVSAPEHFFVRFDDGVVALNVEPLRGGRPVSDRTYMRQRAIAREAVFRGIYLRSESKRQVLASLLANRAGYRALAGRLDEAMADAERSLAIKPYWPQGHVNRGLVRDLKGDRKGADDDYHRAMALDPNCVGALNNLAALYARGAASAAREAEIEYARGLASLATSLAPERPEFHATAAAVALAMGRTRDAVRSMRRAVKLAPWNEAYARRLAEMERASTSGPQK